MSEPGNGAGGNGEDQIDPFDFLDYPCRFEIKALGRRSNRFNALVQAIVSRHIGSEEMLLSQSKHSRNGRYLAVTCVIKASSKDQIRAIYRDLAACPEVLMTL